MVAILGVVCGSSKEKGGVCGSFTRSTGEGRRFKRDRKFQHAGTSLIFAWNFRLFFLL